MVRLPCYCKEWKDKICIFHKTYGALYRALMRVMHHYNWHYAPPCYPDGDTMLWCKWCGFRDVVKYRGKAMDPFHSDVPQQEKAELGDGS